MHSPDSLDGAQHYETRDPIHPIAAGGRGADIGATPSQGRRYQTDTQVEFPSTDITGPAPFRDWGGEGVWIGSAISAESVQPCKLAPHLQPVPRVPYGGGVPRHSRRLVNPHHPSPFLPLFLLIICLLPPISIYLF